MDFLCKKYILRKNRWNYENIDDLKNSKPRVVVYNPVQEAWSYQYFTNSFFKELKKEYIYIFQNSQVMIGSIAYGLEETRTKNVHCKREIITRLSRAY